MPLKALFHPCRRCHIPGAEGIPDESSKPGLTSCPEAPIKPVTSSQVNVTNRTA